MCSSIVRAHSDVVRPTASSTRERTTKLAALRGVHVCSKFSYIWPVFRYVRENS